MHWGFHMVWFYTLDLFLHLVFYTLFLYIFFIFFIWFVLSTVGLSIVGLLYFFTWFIFKLFLLYCSFFYTNYSDGFNLVGSFIQLGFFKVLVSTLALITVGILVWLVLIGSGFLTFSLLYFGS